MLAGVGMVSGFDSLRGPFGKVKPWLITIALWASSGCAAVFVAFRTVSQSDRDYLRWFWDDGFMPFPPRSLTDATWPFGQLAKVFGTFGSGIGRATAGLHYWWPWLFTVVMLIGLWSLARRHRTIAM